MSKELNTEIAKTVIKYFATSPASSEEELQKRTLSSLILEFSNKKGNIVELRQDLLRIAE